MDKNSLDKNSSRSKVALVNVNGGIGQGFIRIPIKDRWAHNTVKLLHFVRQSLCHAKIN